MKCLCPIPEKCLGHLNQRAETGFGYLVDSVILQNGRTFDQVVVTEGCIIEVRGYKGIPFSTDEIADVSLTHKKWNFRDGRTRALKSEHSMPDLFIKFRIFGQTFLDLSMSRMVFLWRRRHTALLLARSTVSLCRSRDT
jgi:hypothetical protein